LKPAIFKRFQLPVGEVSDEETTESFIALIRSQASANGFPGVPSTAPPAQKTAPSGAQNRFASTSEKNEKRRRRAAPSPPCRAPSRPGDRRGRPGEKFFDENEVFWVRIFLRAYDV
jgi:hypothetical protein